ncbi:hypothetical protein ABFX02_10G021500 [Erythranthe guttata]
MDPILRKLRAFSAALQKETNKIVEWRLGEKFLREKYPHKVSDHIRKMTRDLDEIRREVNEKAEQLVFVHDTIPAEEYEDVDSLKVLKKKFLFNGRVAVRNENDRVHAYARGQGLNVVEWPNN